MTEVVTFASSAPLTGAQHDQNLTAVRERPNHTGTQAIATVDGLQTALDGKATSAQGALADTAVQPAAIAGRPERVLHGATAGTARPAVTFVEWVGSVEPTNAVDGDTWVDTSV